MTVSNLSELLGKRRLALLEYCIGTAGKGQYPFLGTPADLFELLRMDPLDTYQVQSSWVAEATSCTQQYIHAVYRKLEPGFEEQEFDKRHLLQWELYNNYPDWAAVQLIACYPENFINPFVRLRKTSLFRNLENNLNQARLSDDSVQAALQEYLQEFEQTCDLDVISCYMDGTTPARADYYFVGRQRVQPFQYFWRKAEIELGTTSTVVSPAAWSEWQAVDIPTADQVLDVRPVFWNGRLCLVWAQWRDKIIAQAATDSVPYKLDINLAFKAQNGQWSPPLNVHSSEHDHALAPGARLIASVRVDYLNPKGKLGILMTGRFTPVKLADFRAHAVYDVLMRTVAHDAGDWLEQALNDRFTSNETVQHPLNSQVPVITRTNPAGNLTPYLDLQVTALRVFDEVDKAEKDVLTVRGFCWPTGLPSGQQELTLELLLPAGGDPAPIKINFDQAGGWVTEPLTFKRDKGTWPNPSTFSFGSSTAALGVKLFDLTVIDLLDFVPVTLHKNSVDAAQFLSFNQAELKLKFVRLNSLFGPELVHSSNISVDAVLDWHVQFIQEPAPVGHSVDEPDGAFNGANGLCFYELFFHLPHLMATRLRDEDRFREAQHWLHYVFDPQAPADPLDDPAFPNPKPAYWRCRPLDVKKASGDPGCESQNPTDPDAIGYAAPAHFQILMFTEYVKNLMAWGDWYYRQLTRDSLVAAKLCYVQAGFLMGKAPTANTATRWKTDTVANLLAQSASRPGLEALEQELDFGLADYPPASDTPPMLGLLACEPFKIPINQMLLDLFSAPELRLNNLRNNLTLDGRPLDIRLFSPPTDPNQLLRDLAAGGAAGPRPMGGRLVVNAFRWRVTFEVALRAVQALQEYGNQVLSLLERRDRAEQEELQQSHLVELGHYAQAVQEQSIAQLEASVAALEQSRALAQERADEYKARYDKNVSDIEYQVMKSLSQSKSLALQSRILKTAGGVVAALPKIFGMSNGGFKPEHALDAAAFALEVNSSLLQIDADRQATTEGYRRRRGDWALQRNQALAEVRAINAQIVAQGHAVSAARTSLEQAVRANSQTLTVFNYLKKRAANAELFDWMLGQLKALHYQAYDAVISLCLSSLASLAAETGDYDAQAPLPQVWLDHRYGLTAGDQLRNFMMGLEQKYVQSRERRLELVKTISLRQLFEDSVDPQAGISDWAQALQQLRETGVLEFKLTQLLFDRDYPGHFCRQISAVEIDLPVLTGPFEDVRATLLQISSMTATRPTTQSVQYLHDPSGVAPLDVLINLRSAQQIALSKGIADDGMTHIKPDEGLLNPFENTGVISRWRLTFPWPKKQPQAGMLQSLPDIIMRIRYTARAGELTFEQKVTDLVNQAETPGLNRPGKGVSSHD
ncbi:Tc toxin subunit A-related protein [Pseudomonas hamedanensis]|uniref:Insecticidal toxin complex protein TcaB2 n=1 Tax=Pseudomonas hamedanensis TaxID=2745504 RepID=A0A9E6NZ59_9PSED|nr:neuraminidase-like domain-containing protein [Pseudomonas hamedanensis]QXI16725.1 insecticidal toxin complex protein TcaB2 [Pseudomonas hamedanensis]